MYKLLDSGEGKKLEQFGSVTLARPAAQAVWRPQLDKWTFDAGFTREGAKEWQIETKLPDSWVIEEAGIKFKLSPTDFGHLGIFPEQSPFWSWIQNTVNPQMEVLNLFAYSGGSTMAAAKGGAKVCHLDASKGMVDWARDNARLNKLENHPIRWIVEDVMRFLRRELKREHFYDAIILDPPSFGRGAKGEVFKIETEIQPLLELVAKLLKPKASFVLFSCHTPGFTPIIMEGLLKEQLPKGKVDSGEMILQGDRPLPTGTYARWVHG
jgi:23S rRNA (cytosine1962-C5)-methyltransferase